jgi:hypothetical protein
MTHNRSVNEKYWEYEEWAQFVNNEMTGIKKWH